MTINEHIINLLYSYDCVIIPGFGGFVARYFPAEIQDGTYMFRPPSKRVSFNARLKENDGLLAHYLSQKEGISYQEAMQTIEISVRAWNRILESGNKISLEGIGKIYLDSEGNLQFTPSLEANFLTSSYGLGLFRSPAISAESMIVQSIRQQAQLEGKVYEHRNAGYFISNLITTVKVASVILVVGSVFYLAVDSSSLFKKSQTDSFSYIGFSAVTDSTSSQEASDTVMGTDTSIMTDKNTSVDITSEIPGILAEPQDKSPEKVVPTSESEHPQSLVNNTSKEANEFHNSNRDKLVKISVGVFSVEANALQRKSQVISLEIPSDIEPSGNYLRVIALCKKDEVNQILQRIKDSIAPDAYVMN